MMNKKCLWCGKELEKLRKKYCSHKCCAKYFYHVGVKKVSVYETHKKLIETEWDCEKNKKLGLDPKKLTSGSHKQAFWTCSSNIKHRWQASINCRTNVTHGGNGCPYCAGHRVSNDNCLENRFPRIAEEWDYKKNKRESPKTVVHGSGKKVWWICFYGHGWKAKISSRTHSGTNCPCCAGQKICKDNCLATLNPIVAKEWHSVKNGSLTPKNITARNSKKKVWWICEKGHEWQATTLSRSVGTNCPYCSGQKTCKDNCLATLFPDIAKEWDYKKNQDLTPNTVTRGSSRKAWWVCSQGHIWEAVIRNRTGRGDGCPACRYKNEGKVKEILEKYFKDWDIISHKKIWDKYRDYNHKRYCDFWMEKNNVKVMVEYDGIQHFEPIGFGCKDRVKVEKLFKRTQKKDKLDGVFCRENSVVLHRIKYNEDKEESIKKLQLQIG
ncbi:MAG: zinc-ribbon domain-containing protein [Candidatus Asgardarchaeia archaeon]